MRYTLSVSEGEVGHYDFLNYHGLPDFDGDGELQNMLRWYDYDKTRPPFWVAGFTVEACGYTLPYAVFCDVYNTTQVHDHIKDGDEFVFVHEGEEYVIVIDSAWPHCEKAYLLENGFRDSHSLSMKDSENER